MEKMLIEQKVVSKIYLIRGKKVMLDRDLAELYNVETKILNQAVKRNKNRFPEDFMFQLNTKEFENWKSQIVTSNLEAQMGLRKCPLAFTEQGVAMLSGVLRSARAVRVNIEIMRAFVSQRRALGVSKKLAERMEKAEKDLKRYDDEIGTLFEDIEALSNPSAGPKRNIGFAGD